MTIHLEITKLYNEAKFFFVFGIYLARRYIHYPTQLLLIFRFLSLKTLHFDVAI